MINEFERYFYVSNLTDYKRFLVFIYWLFLANWIIDIQNKYTKLKMKTRFKETLTKIILFN